jgi:hypothetical protein
MTTIQDFVDQVTPRRTAAFFTILTALYMIFPVILPMKVSTWTQDYYNEIVALPPGSTVAIAGVGYSVPALRSGLTQTPCLMRFLMGRGLKIIYVAFGPASPGNFYLFMTKYSASEEEFGYVYGEDWVCLPFVAGEETAIAAVGDNMRHTEVDMFGTPLEEIPVMENIYTIGDVDLTIVSGGGFTVQPMYVRQWAIKHGVRQINSYSFKTIAIYYGTYVQGVLDHSRGQAEFQYLVGFPGEAIVRFQFRNIGAGIVFIMVIMGNLAIYTGKERRVEEGVKA